MNVWLDDIRPEPEGWILAKTAKEAITLLASGNVEAISLDHDLGEDSETGYDVLLWLEKEVHLNGFKAPRMFVHSANPVGCQRMEQAIKSIIQKQREYQEFDGT